MKEATFTTVHSCISLVEHFVISKHYETKVRFNVLIAQL